MIGSRRARTSRCPSALGLLLTVLVSLPAAVLAQGTAPGAPASTSPAMKAEELDQIVAPIALYPDPLLAQVLMASTYPLEVVQAARWLRENPKATDAQRDEALKQQTWDDSVKSLVSFPQVLTMMNDKLDWTQKLGDAFLDQQKAVMDAVQRLRVRAQAEGNLKSTKEQEVKTEQVPVEAPAAAAAAAAPAPPPPQAAPAAPATSTTVVTIQPTNPQVVYVPTYNPTVVYGAWPYPAYPPYAYYPPGYVAATSVISFGVGMAVGAALWGGCNWGRGDVDINVNRYNNFTKNVNTTNLQNRMTSVNTGGAGGGRQWQHDPQHRKGVQYRDQATQQRYGRADQGGAQNRDAFRGRAEEGRQALDRGAGDQFRQGGRGAEGQPGQGQLGQGQREQGGRELGQGQRDSGQRGQGALADRGSPAQQPARGTPGAGGGGQRASAVSGAGAGGHGGAAFQGTGNGNYARDSSSRGHASLNQARGSGGFQGAGGGAARGGGGGGRRR